MQTNFSSATRNRLTIGVGVILLGIILVCAYLYFQLDQNQQATSPNSTQEIPAVPESTAAAQRVVSITNITRPDDQSRSASRYSLIGSFPDGVSFGPSDNLQGNFIIKGDSSKQFHTINFPPREGNISVGIRKKDKLATVEHSFITATQLRDLVQPYEQVELIVAVSDSYPDTKAQLLKLFQEDQVSGSLVLVPVEVIVNE